MLLLLLIADDHVPITTLMKMHRARAFLSTLRIALVGVNRPDQVPIIAAVLDCCGVYGVFIAAVSNQEMKYYGLEATVDIEISFDWDRRLVRLQRVSRERERHFGRN